MEKEKITRCAIYVRVSTDEQAKEGYSLDAQEERLRILAKSSAWTIYNIYRDEGYSAKNRNRPALKQLLNDAEENKFDVILVYKIDRFSRSLKDLIEIISQLNKYNIGFKSSTEIIDTTTPEGRLMFHQFGSFAQYERELIAQRTKLGLMRRFKQGYWNTIPPLGYKLVDKKLVIDNQEKKIIKIIFELYSKKNMGVKNIALYLNSKGITTRKGAKWRGTRIYKILKNPVYIGKIRWGGSEIEGQHKPIIDKELFYSVDKELKIRKVSTRRYRSPNFLTGFVECGLCHSKMGITYPGKKEYFKYFVCNSRLTTHSCNQEYIRVDILEKSVINEIKKFSNKKKIISNFVDDYLTHSRRKIEKLEKKLNTLKEQIQNIQKDKAKITQAILDNNSQNSLTRILNEKSDDIIKQEDTLKIEMWKIEDKIQILQKKNYGVKTITDYLKHFSLIFNNLDAGEKKLLIESIVEKVEIGKDKRVKFTLIPPYNSFGVSIPQCVS